MLRAEDQPTVPPLTRPDGSLAATEEEIAGELGRHFVAVGQSERTAEYDAAHLAHCWDAYTADVHAGELDDEKVPELVDDDDDHPLLAPFTQEEVERTVRSFKNSGATGLDGIPAAFLKNLDDRLMASLTARVISRSRR